MFCESQALGGLLKSGPYWRISRCTIRRLRLRDGFVMVAAGMAPPGPGVMKSGAD